MEEDKVQCICAGHVCLDIIPHIAPEGGVDFKDLLSPGSLVVIGKAQLGSGGPVSNVGIPLHKLGIRTRFMGKVGDDLFGRGLVELFEPFGGGMTVVPGEITSYTLVLAPPGVDRIFLHSPAANDTYKVQDVDFAQVSEASLFHLGYPPLMRSLYENEGKELAAIFKQAKEAGATTSLDLALPDPSSHAGRAPWRRILTKTLPYVDIFLPSCEELMYMYDKNEFQRLRQEAGSKDPVTSYNAGNLRSLAQECLKLGAAVVGLKLGRRGVYLRTGSQERMKGFGRASASKEFADRELWQPAYRTERVASATGAGDNAIAGFLGAFLRGLYPEECLHVAGAAGADNVRAMDATSGVRSWEETIKSIPERAIHDPEPGPGFTFSSGLRLWKGALDGKGTP